MTSQHGAYALRAGLARLCARMRVHMSARLGNHTQARNSKHAHTDHYVILTAFPRQQWFCERASMLRYTYIGCLVLFYFQSYKECDNVELRQILKNPPPSRKRAFAIFNLFFVTSKCFLVTGSNHVFKVMFNVRHGFFGYYCRLYLRNDHRIKIRCRKVWKSW